VNTLGLPPDGGLPVHAAFAFQSFPASRLLSPVLALQQTHRRPSQLGSDPAHAVCWFVLAHVGSVRAYVSLGRLPFADDGAFPLAARARARLRHVAGVCLVTWQGFGSLGASTAPKLPYDNEGHSFEEMRSLPTPSPSATFIIGRI